MCYVALWICLEVQQRLNAEGRSGSWFVTQLDWSDLVSLKCVSVGSRQLDEDNLCKFCTLNS